MEETKQKGELYKPLRYENGDSKKTIGQKPIFIV
jgi:hypothetical protein